MFGKLADVIAHDHVDCDNSSTVCVTGYTDELPAGEDEVLVDDEVILRAFRRPETFPLINWHAGKSKLRAADHRDPELALA